LVDRKIGSSEFEAPTMLGRDAGRPLAGKVWCSHRPRGVKSKRDVTTAHIVELLESVAMCSLIDSY
jgi:hypothetical protein